jgi:hypothetical protein
MKFTFALDRTDPRGRKIIESMSALGQVAVLDMTLKAKVVAAKVDTLPAVVFGPGGRYTDNAFEHLDDFIGKIPRSHTETIILIELNILGADADISFEAVPA